MSHPLPDPNPPASGIARINSLTVAVQDRPESFDSRTLATMRTAAMELVSATDRELNARAKL